MSQSICTESSDSKSRHMCTVISAFICLLTVAGVFSSKLEGADVPTVEQLRDQPVAFTENRGQWDSQVLYRASSGGTTMWFTKDGIYHQFTRLKHNQTTDPVEQIGGRDPRKFEQMIIKATFAEANASVQVSHEGLMEYKCNYFFGNDSTRWQTNVPNYTAITFRNLYAGIDLKFEAGSNGMESHFIVTPGADLEQIRLQFEGTNLISVNSAGDLIINSRWGELVERKADIYQESSGSRDNYSGSYELVDEQTVRFAVDDNYDASRNLFLAPTLTFSSYLGGSGLNGDLANDLVANPSREAILVGYTASADFPIVNAFDNTNAQSDGFITKFSTSGTSLIFSTYLGGSGSDNCEAVSITSSMLRGIFVVGNTTSPDFPMVNAVDASANGEYDGFLVALGEDGSGTTGISFSTYFGGSNYDLPGDMAVQCVPPCAADQYTVWITGATNSTNFPTSNAYDVTLSGILDAFLTEFTIGVSGNSMGRSTYFGGGDQDAGLGVVIIGGAANRPHITGTTSSTNFPVINPFDGTFGNVEDAFLAGFDFAGNGQMYPTFSTYYGGSDNDNDLQIVARSSGNLIIAGSTRSTDLPISVGYDNSYNGNYDGFIAEFNSNGSSLVFSTYLGGNQYERLYGLALDQVGNVHVTGYTQSTDFPMVNAYDATLSGIEQGDVFIGSFNPTATTLQFSTFLGGAGVDQTRGIAIDNLGCIYVAGSTSSSDFPVVNPYDPTLNGSDAFLTKICLQTYVCGDADGSEIVTISDAVLLINYIFAGGPAPNPLLSGDADCSGSVTISDAVYLINYIFAGGAVPCASCP